LLCFPDTELDGAARLCETLRSAVEGAGWADLGLAQGVTLSFGLAEAHPGATSDALLREADRRLYAAKRQGRNRIVAA